VVGKDTAGSREEWRKDKKKEKSHIDDTDHRTPARLEKRLLLTGKVNMTDKVRTTISAEQDPRLIVPTEREGLTL
jgi:hypothetical protein